MASEQYDPNLGSPQQGGQYGPSGGQYGGGQYGPGGAGPYGQGGGPYGPGGGGGPYHGPGGPRRPEKQDEKEHEKRQEKGGGMDEKYHRDPVRFFSMGFWVIWLGVILLLQNVNVLDKDDHIWGLFFWGWGGLTLVEAGIRMANPRWRRPNFGSFIFGAILVGVGFGLWFDRWEVIGPLVIIAVGIAILAGRLVRRR
jgi:hypothetical protein